MPKERMINVVEEICECGRSVKAMNPSILKINMETHRRGKQHKELMAYKEKWLAESKKPRSHTKLKEVEKD